MRTYLWQLCVTGGSSVSGCTGTWTSGTRRGPPLTDTPSPTQTMTSCFIPRIKYLSLYPTATVLQINKYAIKCSFNGLERTTFVIYCLRQLHTFFIFESKCQKIKTYLLGYLKIIVDFIVKKSKWL